MAHPRFNSDEVARRGKVLYEAGIRARVENDTNVGKLVSIDVETGDYEIREDLNMEAPRRLHAKHPAAVIYTFRRPLLDTALLNSYELVAQFTEGGLATVDPI